MATAAQQWLVVRAGDQEVVSAVRSRDEAMTQAQHLNAEWIRESRHLGSEPDAPIPWAVPVCITPLATADARFDQVHRLGSDGAEHVDCVIAFGRPTDAVEYLREVLHYAGEVSSSLPTLASLYRRAGQVVQERHQSEPGRKRSCKYGVEAAGNLLREQGLL